MVLKFGIKFIPRECIKNWDLILPRGEFRQPNIKTLFQYICTYHLVTKEKFRESDAIRKLTKNYFRNAKRRRNHLCVNLTKN